MHAQRQPSSHDGLAIITFFCGFLLPLVGFILGLVSISSAHRDGREASGLAITGTIVGGLISVAITALIISVAVASTQS